MPRIAPRYYSPEFPDGITPSAFRRLGKERKLEVMRAWFFQNFEDPAERTPYESREGGYQWIWGGPYDAREELESEFGNDVSESIINELIDEIEAEGYEWAPTPKNSDYDHDDRDDGRIVDGDGEWPSITLSGGTEQDKLDGGIERDPLDEIQGLIDFGITPEFGSPEERAAREAVVSSLEEIGTVTECVFQLALPVVAALEFQDVSPNLVAKARQLRSKPDREGIVLGRGVADENCPPTLLIPGRNLPSLGRWPGTFQL